VSSPQKNPPLFEVKNLTKSFTWGNPVLRDVSFTLNRGSWTILAGSNGSGKTVLMNHLNGLEKPDRGSLFFKGRNITLMGDEIRRRVGLVFQNSDLQFVEQSVEKELLFGPVNLGYPTEKRERLVESVISQLGLEELRNRRPHTLSGGEKKRVAIGGILTMEPDLLVLDEPFTGLDWEGVDQVLKTLIALHREGMTLLLITHDLAKCLAHGDHMIVMSRGKIRLEGNPNEILSRVEEWGIKKPGELTWLK
jgi:biotin transport system ATP-binding protein